MAFQFVPNADGSFTEGDKQTNPETNQEYIFTDGAWRPLGIEVATDLVELDARYVKTEGNSDFKGDLYMKPPASEVSRFRVLEANTPHTFEITSHPRIGGQLTASKVHIRIKNQKDANDNDNPETIIRWVPDPTQPDHAVNKAYVDNNALTGDFLPISGGTLTGDLTISDNKNLNFTEGDGDLQFKILTNVNDRFTNIYSFVDEDTGLGGMRFRVSSDQNTGGTYGTGITISKEDNIIGGTTYAGQQQSTIYKLQQLDTTLLTSSM